MISKAKDLIGLGRTTAAKTFTRNNNLAGEARNAGQARARGTITNRGCAACSKAPLFLLITLVLFALTATPALALPTHFATEGSAAGQISEEPRGLAIEQQSGDVYVTDRNNNRIDKFGPEGEFLLAWGWGVADGTTAALQTCTTPCFAGLSGSGAGQLSGEAEGIAVDNSLDMSHGDVYVVDTANHRIDKFGPDGEFKLSFGVEGSGPGQFDVLTGRSIAVSAGGTVYVGDRERVQLFSETGVPQSQIALTGAGNIENLALAPAEEDFYVKSSALEGVREYDHAGAELPPPRDEAGEQEAKAIAVGPSGELFVNELSAGAHHILAFNAAGAPTASFDAGSEAQDAGKHGIAYSEHTNALYVANHGSVRIVTPPPPGPFVLLGSETATEVDPGTATLGATVNPEGPEATTYHFEYGTTTAYSESTKQEPLPAGPPFTDQPVSAAIAGLAPSTPYHYRIVSVAQCEKEPVLHPGVKVECTTEGPDEAFTTLPPVTIDSTSASEVDDTSARLQAELNPHGLSTTYRFEYDTKPYGEGEAAHGARVSEGSAGAGTTDTTVANLVQGLASAETYYYRVVAFNALSGPEGIAGPGRSFTTQGAASSVLPDGREWELVSPPNKHGSPLEPLTEEGGVIQAAAGGGAFAYVALGPVNGEPAGVRSPDDSQLVAKRGTSGWETQDVTTPHEELSKIKVGVPSEYKQFSEDLSAGAVEPEGATRLAREDPANTERTPYLRSDFAGDGAFCAERCYSPLLTADNVLPDAKFGGEEIVELGSKTGSWTGGTKFLLATPDLSHVVLESPQVLAGGFKPGFVPAGQPNLYELSGGSLQLISVLPSGEATTEAGLSVGVGRSGLNTRAAISSDGERTVFSTSGSEAHLYMRDIGLGQTLQLDERQPGAVGGLGVAAFQGAGRDGSKVFFTDPSRLTTDATAQEGKPDLYMCEASAAFSAGERDCSRHLTDLTIDHNAGEAANVQGEVSAIDTAGEHVYFAADGVLTNTPNARGEHAVPGDCNSEGEATCNMYEYDTSTRTVVLVAVLSSADDPDWAGRTNLHVFGNLTARSSPDGRYLAFMSQLPLTGYDSRDARSGAPDAEVFLFDAATGQTVCVSCNPTGARPQGVFDKHQFPGLLVDHPSSWSERWLAASIPGWTLGPSKEQSLYQSRYLSDSGRLFFNAADGLVPQDKNNVEDVYEYERVGGPESEGQPASNTCTTASATYSPASGGCVSLISSGTSKEESAFLDASENGDEVFFLTSSRLTSSDVDSAFDVYDAHACNTESPCVAPPASPSAACQGDACQNPGASPSFPNPSSLTAHGDGNVTPRAVVKPKAKPLTRAQKLSKALKTCRKHKRQGPRASCEKQARRKYGPIKQRGRKR